MRRFVLNLDHYCIFLLEEFVKLRVFIFVLLVSAFAAILPAAAQTDSVIAQISSSSSESFAGAISGEGRIEEFESSGDVATVNARNADRNPEIFLWDFAQRRIY